MGFNLLRANPERFNHKIGHKPMTARREVFTVNSQNALFQIVRVVCGTIFQERLADLDDRTLLLYTDLPNQCRIRIQPFVILVCARLLFSPERKNLVIVPP